MGCIGVGDRVWEHINEIVLNLGTLLFFISIHSIAPYISRYAVSLGASEQEVALLGPALSIMAVTVRPLSGVLIDRGKLFFLIVAGIASAIIAQIVYGFSSDVRVLYMGRAIQGIGVALFIPASIYTATIIGRRAASALAWRSTMIGLSMAIGPAVGGIIISLYSYRALFNLALILLTVSAILNIEALRKLSYTSGGEKGYIKDLYNVCFIIASIAILCYSLMYNSFTLFLPAYHKVLGVEVAMTATIFTVISIFNFISRILLSVLINKIRFYIIATIGYGLAVLGVTLVTVDPLSPYILLYATITGIGGGLLIPSLQVIAILGVVKRSRGMASGIYTTMFDIGNIIGPPTTISLGATYIEALKLSLILSCIGLATLLGYAVLSRYSVSQC